MESNVNRRKFLKTATIAGVGAIVVPNIALGKKKYNKDKVRIGFIGIGGRGRSHLSQILQRDDVEVPAMCDIDPEAVKKAQDLLKKYERNEAEIYSDSEYAYKKMVTRDDLDGIIISTPWLWHTPMAIDAMKAGKFVGVEVSATVSLQDSWDLVNTYEETGSHCMILENVCYRRDVMAVLNMVKKGMFGEILHGRCGYQHDLRGVKFQPGLKFGKGSRGEARWRTEHSIKRNGDVYPTHGLGPIATMMDINRGNRFEFLTATATKARGLHDYIIKKGGKDHPYADIKFKLGDVVTSVIKTARDETIIVTHDTNLPRPYSLGFRIQGTDGLTEFDKGRRRIYLEGEGREHAWVDFDKEYQEKYDHPLWAKMAKDASGAGHGGMDFFIDRAFVECIKQKAYPPIDVYDAAVWSAVSPLSEQSIALGSAPVKFPDFTRGKWISNKPIFGISDEF
ncbi:Gfo/Idh/MocA family protein [Bacteroidota bacterium]